MRPSCLHAGLAGLFASALLAACTRPAAQDPPVGAAAAAPTAATAANASHRWRCGEREVRSRYDPASGTLSVQLEAQTLTLAQARSGSGTRYADGAGNAFWEHQGQATVTLASGIALQCRLAP